MKTLSPNWLTEGLIDAEYKRYILLAYLQEISQQFGAIKLYPYLSELVAHYQNLLRIKENKSEMENRFPSSGTLLLEPSNKQTTPTPDEDVMKELEEIISFSLPELKKHVEEGKDIYEFVERHMELEPVGMESIYKNEGYLLIPSSKPKSTHVYEYQITLFTNASENYRAVRTQYVESVSTGIGYTYEMVKVDLAKKYNKLSNPSTYLVSCTLACPMNETILPIAKRRLVRLLGAS